MSRTKNWPLPCRDSPEREQREIPGLVWEWLAGIGSGACWAETNQSKSRERFLVLVGLIKQDQELYPALQRHPREGVERYYWSCLGMVSRNMKWSMLGRDKPEQEQREVPSPVWLD